jgi:hypothetical protein
MERRTIRGWVWGLQLCLLLSVPPALRAADPGKLFEDWRQRAEAIEAQLKGQDWQNAWTQSGALIDSMRENLGPNPQSVELLASAVSRRALAAAGAGREDEAVWLWHVAQNLHPAYRTADFSAYGAAGETLRRRRLRVAGQLPSPGVQSLAEAGPDGRQDGVRPPRKISGDDPRVPAAVHQSGGELLRIEVLIDAEGRVSHPVVLSGIRHPAYVYAALENLRSWRFQPAESAGESASPVPVLYEIDLASRPPFEKVDEKLAAAEAPLRRGDWAAAESAARARMERLLAEADVADRGAFIRALTQLAVAEAGRGRPEDALWHWQEAQSLADLSRENLAVYGEPGRFLLRHPLRDRDQPPGQMAVYRLEGSVQAPRLPAGAALRLPSWLRVQAVVDAEGRIQAPVLEGGSDFKTVHEVFQAARSLRLEPARQQGEAVAVFWDLPTAAPEDVALPAVAGTKLPGGIAAVREALIGRRWEDARLKANGLFNTVMEQNTVSRRQAAMAETFRALAAAGAGERAVAACRWRLAQDLWPALYDLDLSEFGEAGAFLERQRAERGAAPAVDYKPAARPIASASRVRSTRPAQLARFSGQAQLSAVVDAEGFVQEARIRNLLPYALDIPARDGVCGMRFAAQSAQSGTAVLSVHSIGVIFQPASYSGTPTVALGNWGYAPNPHPGKNSDGSPVGSTPYNNW